MFAVKFDNQLVYSQPTVTSQETVTIQFDNTPAEHTLELILFSSTQNQCSIAVGNFKLNQFDLLDHKVYRYFVADGDFQGILQGTRKVLLVISTPVIGWLQQTKTY
jgi:hypothetical protein